MSGKSEKRKKGTVTIKTRQDKRTGRTIVSARSTGDVDLRNVIGGLPTPKKYWALILKYVPFVMGGDVMQPRRYETEGEPVKVGKYACFAFHNEVADQHQVHDIKSGGLLGHGKTLAEAIKLAKKNIATTPDLDAQMAKVNLMECDTVTREWALEAGNKKR